MRLSLGELKELIAEAFAEAIPNRNDVESQLQDSRADRSLGNKTIASLTSKFPMSSKLFVSALAQRVMAWQNGKVPWSVVLTALDKLYGSVKTHRIR